MDFELTDEQRLLRDTLRDFVDREIRPVVHEWEAADRYPAEIVEKMKGLGLFGLTVPAEYGGLDVDMVSFALVFEEISKGWMGIAGILGSHSLSCWMIARHGTEEQKARFLPDLAAGRRRTGIGLTEPGAGTDLQGIATTARRDGDHYVIDGTKTALKYAAQRSARRSGTRSTTSRRSSSSSPRWPSRCRRPGCWSTGPRRGPTPATASTCRRAWPRRSPARRRSSAR